MKAIRNPLPGFQEDLPTDDWKSAAISPSAASVVHVLTLGAKGRVLLPAAICEAMELQVGDRLIGCLQNGILTIESQRAGIKRAQADVAQLVAPGASLSEELIGDRRREAAQEWDAESMGPLPEILMPYR